MADTLAILGCIVALVGAFCLVNCSRCQHYRLSYGGSRCADCGMSRREIVVSRHLGLDRRKDAFVAMGECPFDPVFEYIIYNLVENPDKKSPMMYIETMHVDPDAPPHIKELYESMMFRRHGIAWLWKKHAQTSHS